MRAKNVRNGIAAITAVALLGASGVGVSAMQGGSGDDGIMPLYYCGIDGCELSPMVRMCALDYTHIANLTHTWGIFVKKTCNYDTYEASSYDVCTNGHVIRIEGQHFCKEEHDVCGNGTRSVCPFGGEL